MPKSSTPGLLLMTVRLLRASRVQRTNQVFGNPAEAKATHQDRGAIGDERDGIVGTREHFVHAPIIEPISRRR